MRLPRTLSRYLAREILIYGILAFLVITALLVSHNLIRRLDDLMMVGFSLADLGVVMRALMTMMAVYASPLALLAGTLLATRRIASDGEVTALRACGVGLNALLIPTLSVAAAIAVLTAYLVTNVEHKARREILATLRTVAARGGMFETGKFANLSHGVLFVESRDRDGTLRRILISDNSRPDRRFKIFAETGTFSYDSSEDLIRLRLRNGALHLEPEGDDFDSYHRMNFDEFEYNVDVSAHLGGANAPVRPKQMTSGELRSVVERARRGDSLQELHEKNPIEYELEIQRRYAMPAAPLLFGLLAVPLGVSGSRRGRTVGLMLGALLAFTYYSLLSVTQLLARGDWISPLVAQWLPNVALLVAACYLVFRESRAVPK